MRDVAEYEAEATRAIDAMRAQRQQGMTILQRAIEERLSFDERAIHELQKIWDLPSGKE
jgi:hypothetical protein